MRTKKKQPKKYVCSVEGCRKSYTERFNLNEHKKRTHLKKWFMCQTCEEVFTAASSLKRHAKAIYNQNLDARDLKACEVRRKPSAPISATDDALLIRAVELHCQKNALEDQIRDLQSDINALKFYNILCLFLDSYVIRVNSFFESGRVTPE